MTNVFEEQVKSLEELVPNFKIARASFITMKKSASSYN